MRGTARRASALGLGALLSGCGLPIQNEMDGVTDVARYATRYDHVVGPRTTLIDRALADCPEKTAKAETACVKEAVGAAGLSGANLAASVPGCRPGQVCAYEQTTRDRLGFVEASATLYSKRWHVSLDFRGRPGRAADVPLTVTDRDDFEAAPAPH